MSKRESKRDCQMNKRNKDCVGEIDQTGFSAE